ncbi:MAG: sigma-70 family RNA polymerase sigma factor [Vicinamibacterales bacterium]
MTSDEETRAAVLMRLAQSGDDEAYSNLLMMLTGIAGRFARNRLGPASWLDDVVQETLWSVHRARHTWSGDRPFAPWFYAIVSRRMIDVYRRRRRVALREEGRDSLEAVATTSGESRHGVDIDAVRAALAALPPRQRDIVEGLKLREETVRSLAARHGMSETAVKVMAHRGYKRLRSMLGEPPEGRT